MTIDVENLKAERERVKGELRKLEQEQRRLEAELKSFRQKEIRAKRQIEALTTLIDINHPSPAEGEEPTPG